MCIKYQGFENMCRFPPKISAYNRYIQKYIIQKSSNLKSSSVDFRKNLQIYIHIYILRICV